MSLDRNTLVAGVATAGAVTVAGRYFFAKNKKKEMAPAKLRVYGFLPLPPYADSSPACLKLQTFLKMTKTDYEYQGFPDHNMAGCPMGKMPYCHGRDLGTDNIMGDSTLIMNALVQQDPDRYDLDTHLTDEERAIGTAFKVMLEESTYFAVVHVRWNTREYDRVTVPMYFTSIPFPLRGLISRHVQRKMIRDLKGHGTGLLNEEQVLEKTLPEIEALSTFLGPHKRYLFGDQISSFDATVYAYLASLVQGDWQHGICELVRDCPNLVAYVERMTNEFFSGTD